MRILVRSLAFGFCFASFGYAATITVDTAAFVRYADNSARVTDNTGSVVVGTYTAEPSFTDPPTVSQVLTGLQILGGITSTFEDSLGGFDGFFRFDLDVEIPVSFDGDDVYIVLGNNATLASSTEFLVWKATSNPDGNTFSEDEVSPVGGPGTIVLNNSTGTLLLGSFESGEFLLDAIPEPSTTSALMLGGLAMLMRRRR